MHGMRWALALATMTGTLAACPLALASTPAKQEAYLAKVVQVVKKADAGGAADACKRMSRLRDDEVFATLPAEQKAAVQADAGYVYLLCDRNADAVAELKASVAGKPDMWSTANLAVAAERISDWDTCARAIIDLAGRWPDKLDDTWARRAWRSYHGLGANPELRRRLFQAFHDANFQYAAADASSMWYELARMHLDAGDVERARQAAARVADGDAVMRMRVDRRFDPIVVRDARAFDARAQAQVLVDNLRRKSIARPRDVNLWIQLGYAQLAVGDHQGVIDDATRVLDALAPTMNAKQSPPGWQNADKRVWLYNNRAVAYARMGRVDLAIADLTQASTLPEYGARNVSQVLNLGTLLCYAGRPAEAVQQVSTGMENMAPYGKLVQSLVLLCAAVQRDDRAAMLRLAQSILATAEDANATVRLEAYLWTGNLEAAEGEYLKMLQDPAQRSDALVYAQQTNHTPGMPGRATLDRNREALLARPAVKAAIEKVGRVERFDLNLSSTFE